MRISRQRLPSTLVEKDEEVSIETGLRAAEKLQSFLDNRDRGVDVAQMWVTLDRLINAVKSAVPEEMWGDIVEKLQQSERESKALSLRVGARYDGSTDPDDPADFNDERDATSRVEEEAERRHHDAFLAQVDGRRVPNGTIEASAPAIREFSPKTVKDDDEDDI